MSRGTNLQKMEEEVKQSKTAVNANAKPAEPMQKLSTGGTAATWEDLGGPTPDNYSPTNDSAKLKDPAGSLKQVSDVVTNRKGKTLKQGDEPEVTDEQEVVAEEPATEVEEIVAEEETVEETVEINVEDDVNALLGGEELSEEFRAKAKTIFEAAINSKVAGIREEIVREHEEKLSEEVEEIKVELQERVDSYLEYVADEWFVENQLAVENGLKADMTESFLEGMKGLFEEHYVSIPEEKYDVLESMVNKLDEMEGKLNEQIDRNVVLNKRLAESTSDGILSDVSEGLAVTQKEKLATLAESVEFDSETDYREKLVTLREAYFPSRPSAQRDSSEYIAEEASMNQNISGSMEGYLTALQRVTKK